MLSCLAALGLWWHAVVGGRGACSCGAAMQDFRHVCARILLTSCLHCIWLLMSLPHTYVGSSGALTQAAHTCTAAQGDQMAVRLRVLLDDVHHAGCRVCHYDVQDARDVDMRPANSCFKPGSVRPTFEDSRTPSMTEFL